MSEADMNINSIFELIIPFNYSDNGDLGFNFQKVKTKLNNGIAKAFNLTVGCFFVCEDLKERGKTLHAK